MNKKQAVSFIAETSYDRALSRGMGIVDPSMDEFLLVRKAYRINSMRSLHMNDNDIYINDSFVLHKGPRYSPEEDYE